MGSDYVYKPDSTYKWWEKDPNILVKLEKAFAIGASDPEACYFAGITDDQLYYYQKHINLQFRGKKDLLKQRPILIARQSVVDGLKKDPELALKYLERKLKDEFSLRTEHTGTDGAPLKIELEAPDEISKLSQISTKAKRGAK